jgi:hypothetical protein
MFQRDFLLNEARKFAEMLARLMGLKAEERTVEFNRQADALLQKEYDTSLEHLLNLSVDSFNDDIANSNTVQKS